MPALYLDCDGFFASCEESADPALHGRPVGVSTTEPANPGAVLIAVNPEAKRRGAAKAPRKRREPATREPPCRTSKSASNAPNSTLLSITRSLGRSIPWCRARHRAQSTSFPSTSGPMMNPETVLRDVKGAIRQAVGSIVTVSCAVAPSAYLAKTAAEADKPDAATRVAPRRPARGVRGTRTLGPPGTRARDRRAASAVRNRHRARTARCAPLGGAAGVGLADRRRRPQSAQGTADAGTAKARPIMRFLVTCALHRCAREGVAPETFELEVISEGTRAWTRSAPVERSRNVRRSAP